MILESTESDVARAPTPLSQKVLLGQELDLLVKGFGLYLRRRRVEGVEHDLAHGLGVWAVSFITPPS